MTPAAALRPALAALVLVAAVVLTGVVLFLWWPGGVALGIALGGGSVLAVGARMATSNARVPSDEALQQRLGMTVATREPVAVAAAPAPRRTAVTVPAVAPLHAQPDDAFFVTGPAQPAPVVDLEPAPPVVVEQQHAAPVEPEPEPVAEPADVEPHPAPVEQPAPVEPENASLEPAPAAVHEDDGPDTIPATDFVLTDEGTVRTDLERLKAELGDGYSDFARAVRLVVSTQYASAARLQRDLDVPYSRARRLLTDLEQQHVVGPATGSLPRVVLMPKDRLTDLERLLEEV